MKLLKLLPILILSLLLAFPSHAADGTIDDQTSLGAQPATDDTLPIWDASAGATKKVTYANMVDIRNADSYGGLTAAVTAIAATKTTIICNSTQTIAGDLSIPTTLTLICTQGCSLEPASTKTLTINSTPIAGDYLITGGSGTVTFAGTGLIWASWTGGSAGSLSLADSDLLDLSSINGSSATEGLKLPQAADVSASTAEGQISWDTDNDKLNVGTGTGTVVISADSGIMSSDTIWDVAGDIVYGTGSDTATRLAKGAANTKLFINAGATAPEWANGMKIGTFTIDTATASGDQAITGVGFKPSHIILLAGISGTPEVSIGFDDGTSHYNLDNIHNVTADAWGVDSSLSILLYQTGAIYYSGIVSALGADGFTITWIKAGAKTGTATIYYLALR